MTVYPGKFKVNGKKCLGKTSTTFGGHCFWCHRFGFYIDKNPCTCVYFTGQLNLFE